jgi:hypothetical protein
MLRAATPSPPCRAKPFQTASITSKKGFPRFKRAVKSIWYDRTTPEFIVELACGGLRSGQTDV